MKELHALTKATLVIDIAAAMALIIYFTSVAPYPPIGLGGFLIISPPLFGAAGLITTILGMQENKKGLSIVLMALNVIFICWLPIMWVGGIQLFGP